MSTTQTRPGAPRPLDQEARSDDATPFELAFAFFNEIGIIDQLSGAMLQSALPNGMHPSHFAIMMHLHRRGDAKTPVEIAAAMQVTKATMTHSLKVLEKHRIIETRPNPKDARGKLVYLTPEGEAFRLDALKRLMERFGRLLTTDQVSAMRRTLDDLTAIRKYLDENRD